MSGLAEELGRRYLAQPYGGSGYPRLLAEIRRVYYDPMLMCPECEIEGCLTVLAWPERSGGGHGGSIQGHLRLRYYLCIYCGYRRRIVRQVPRPSIFTQEQVEAIIRMYQGGYTSTQIGQHFHCSKTQVTWLLEKHGVPRRARGGKPPLYKTSLEDLARTHYLYEVKGLSQVQIAQELGVTIHVIRTRIRRMDEAGWFARRHPKGSSQKRAA